MNHVTTKLMSSRTSIWAKLGDKVRKSSIFTIFLIYDLLFTGFASSFFTTNYTNFTNLGCALLFIYTNFTNEIASDFLPRKPIREIRCILGCIIIMILCIENSFNSLNSWSL
jgi:hypothetical protein